jgi:hypothetical protein
MLLVLEAGLWLVGWQRKSPGKGNWVSGNDIKPGSGDRQGQAQTRHIGDVCDQLVTITRFIDDIY